MHLLAATGKSSGFNPTELILILVVVVGFYMLMIRPQRRRQQRVAQQQNSVRPGARVRTTAGMYATVVAVDEESGDVVLEVAPNVEVRYMKRAIMDVVSPGDEPEETESAYEAEDAEAETTPEQDEDAVDPRDEETVRTGDPGQDAAIAEAAKSGGAKD